MKYFVIADAHGYYDLMIKALEDAGFDATNENHTLISLGDAMDRGKQPVQVIKYLNSLPRKVLIRGNHEDLLSQLMQSSTWMECDVHNGTLETLKQLAEARQQEIKVKGFPYLSHKYFPVVRAFASTNKDWKLYKENMVDYFETEHYVFIHGWIPTTTLMDGYDVYRRPKYRYIYRKDWREANIKDWEEARWSNGSECAVLKVFEPNKTIVCGHWTASDFHMKFEGAEPFKVFTPYQDKNVIALDATTSSSGFVNVVVLED